jgi:VanZ family protein
MSEAGRLFLPRYIVIAYALLIVYASLYPFSGWRDQGVPVAAFLFAPLPRYFTWFDVIANIAAYGALGLMLVMSFNMPSRPLLAVFYAVLAAFALSLALEALQAYLPSRIASNLDVICNTGGAFLGALVGARLAPAILSPDMHALRVAWLAPGRHTDLGLVLLGLWLLTQANPALLLFGNGDLRSALGLSLAPFSADVFRVMETAIVALNLIALGALTALIARERIFAWAGVAMAVALTLLGKALASALIFKPENYLVWLTPGAQDGLTIGLLVLLVLPLFPRGGLMVIAAILLAAAVTLVNLVPTNPYHLSSLPHWQQGQFLNFDGLTSFVALLWPFAAMLWAIGASRGPKPGKPVVVEAATL